MNQPKGVPDSQICSGLSPSTKLCGTCERLDLQTMLCDETNEEFLGCLSDYNDPSCPFCDLISKSISLAWGTGWNSASLCLITCNPPQLFIQSRSPLSVKENGRTDYPQPRLLLATDLKPPGFQHNRAPLREIDRVENRFVIAEIESLPDDSTSSASERAHLLPRREVADRINVKLVKHWLEECQKHRHSKKTVTEKKRNNLCQPENPFRLIDVIDECLVQKTENCDYVALSYVWGRLPTILYPGDDPEAILVLLTIRENVKGLSFPKGLSPTSLKSGRIPRTVRDAMELVRKIGMRYLWVDTLCIIQDDPVDKLRLIGKMDDVYDNAKVTIVAAAGSDADAGLKGVSPRKGCPIEPIKIVDTSDGTILNLSVSLQSLCEEVRRETWNTRGWTFQEQCLSQRCLFFTAEEIFFNCTEVQWREGYDYGEEKHEDFEMQVRTGPPWWSMKLRKDLDPTPYHYLGDVIKGLDIHNYQKTVQDYSRTNLTFPQDALNAFEGVYNRFQRCGNTPELSIRQTQGIPTHFLFQAILWFPSDTSHKRLCNPTQAGGVAEQFSTWSWASWIGPIEFVFAESLCLSRNISQAPIKHVPMYVPIIYWYYGGSSRKFWTCNTWKTVCEASNVPDELSHTRGYLNDRAGIDVDLILSRSLNEVQPPTLSSCELGFFGPYLPSAEFCISVAKDKRVGSLKVSAHHGEFRFDGDVKEVDELVAVVVANTITKAPDTETILLGLTTRDGISSRVGIGFIYYSKNPSSRKPRWEYKFFKVC